MTPSLCLQERLLLSLLPAHIARVMKAEIIQRLQGPNFGRTESTNNFHNLYVQRHTNVRWGSFVFASLHFIKVIIFPSHLGVWLLLYHSVLPPSSLLLFSARSHSCSYSMGLLLYSSSSVISLLYSSPLFFFFTSSSLHPIFFIFPFITMAKFIWELIHLLCALRSLCQTMKSLCPLFSILVIIIATNPG